MEHYFGGKGSFYFSWMLFFYGSSSWRKLWYNFWSRFRFRSINISSFTFQILYIKFQSFFVLDFFQIARKISWDLNEFSVLINNYIKVVLTIINCKTVCKKNFFKHCSSLLWIQIFNYQLNCELSIFSKKYFYYQWLLWIYLRLWEEILQFY